MPSSRVVVAVAKEAIRFMAFEAAATCSAWKGKGEGGRVLLHHRIIVRLLVGRPQPLTRLVAHFLPFKKAEHTSENSPNVCKQGSRRRAIKMPSNEGRQPRPATGRGHAKAGICAGAHFFILLLRIRTGAGCVTLLVAHDGLHEGAPTVRTGSCSGF